jgi:hypothetical protein
VKDGHVNFIEDCSLANNILLPSFPIFLEHRTNLQLLQSLPSNAVNWSMLCPNWMVPETSEISLPGTTPYEVLVASAGTPPRWQDSWLRHVPLIGKTLVSAMNATRYQTTLEQNAEFIAKDLEGGEGEWVGQAVGIISASK